METTSDTEDDDSNDSNDSHHEAVGGDSNDRSDPSGFMKYTLTDDILLDSATNSEIELEAAD